MAKALAALTFVVLLVVAAPAQAWTNPLPVSNPDEAATHQGVGIDHDGNAVVVFRNSAGGIFVNTRSANEVTGAPRQINAGQGTAPRIATNDAGTSVVAWLATDGGESRVHMRLRRPSGTFTNETTISPAGQVAAAPEVGIDAAGDAFVSWQAGDDPIRTYLRVRSGGTGMLGPVVPISPTTGQNNSPHLAVEPGGRAFMTWNTGDGIFGRARNPSGALSATKHMAPDQTIFSQSVSIDGSGRALVAWSGGPDAIVKARTRTADGHVSTVVELSKPAPGRYADFVTTAAATTTDTDLVSWTQTDDAATTLISRRLVGTAWRAQKSVTPSTLIPANTAMGTSANAGRTTIVFTSFENGGTVLRLRARELHADDSLGPMSILTAENGQGGGGTRLAVNASGQAAATWFSRVTFDGFDLVWIAANFLHT